MSIVASRLAEENDRLRKLAKDLSKDLKWLANRYDLQLTSKERLRVNTALDHAKAELAE